MADEVGAVGLAGALTAGEGRVGAGALGLETDTPVVAPAVAEALGGAVGRLGLGGAALTETDAVGVEPDGADTEADAEAEAGAGVDAETVADTVGGELAVGG